MDYFAYSRIITKACGLTRTMFDNNRKMGDKKDLGVQSHERSVTASKTWFHAPCIRPQQFSFLLEARTILPPDEERKEDSHSKQEGESFLIEQKFGQRIKELSAAIIPLVTTIISIISLLFKFGY